jgi:predicted Zn-dependent protease
MKKITVVLIICAFFLLPFSLMGQVFPGSKGGSPFGSTGSGGNAFAAAEKTLNAEESSYTREDEYYLGRAVAANILASYRPYQNPALTSYLNRICRTLAINSSQPEIFNGYHVIVLDSASFNAFATPGGHILVTRGLVAAAPSEDALAGVIAHELAHIILRHAMGIIEEMKPQEEMAAMAQRAADFNRQFGSAATAAAADRISAYRESVDGIITAMVKNGFSREQEFAADAAAVKLLADSGYDPGGLLEILKVLQKNQYLQPGGFNSTHPTPADRITSATRTSASLRVKDTRSSRTARFKDSVKNIKK